MIITPERQAHGNSQDYISGVEIQNQLGKEGKTQVPSLAYEVAKIRYSGQEHLYLLPDTGFQVKTQIDLLFENYKNGVSLSETFEQLEQDVQAFKTEYLVEGPVFPIQLKKVQKNGATRIIGSQYADKLWLDATDGVEREGAVKESVQKMEEILVTAPSGTTVLMTSPDGWSGYSGIEYPDSQTYVLTVLDDGSIQGFTLKTDMSLSQNEDLLRKYGVELDAKSGLTEKDRIKRAVGSVVKFDPKDKKNAFSIAKDIMQLTDSDVVYVDSTDTPRYFTEMLGLLEHPEPLIQIDDTVKRLTRALSQYISYRITFSDSRVRQDIEVAMGYTVLKLMHEIRPPKNSVAMKEEVFYSPMSDVVPAPFNPVKTLENLQKIGGCAGGNKKKNGMTIVSSLTPRNGVEMPGVELEGEGGCSCEENTDNHYHCPDCDKKFDDETQKKPEERTKKCNCGFEFGC